MGAKQRAQARSKNKKSPKGSMKGSPWSQKQSSSTLFARGLDPSVRHKTLQGWHDFASAESAASSARNGFSMTQEARNTERHVSGWGTSRLRDNTISFVSAGNLTRDEPQSSSGEEQDNTVGMEAQGSRELDHVNRADSLPPEDTQQQKQQSTENSLPKDIGEVYSPAVATPQYLSNLQQEEDVASASSSEAEEILFHGRGKPAVNPLPMAKEPDSAVTNGHGHQSNHSTLPTQPVSIPIRIQQGPVASSSEPPSSWFPKRTRAGRLDKRRQNRNVQASDEEEAIMQDYIANMAMDDDEDEDESSSSKPQRRNETFRFHTGTGEENVKVQTKSKPSKQNVVHIDEAADWDSADLDDFDELATTDDEVDQIGQVLRHRERPSGAQYLVTAVGKGASDAKWMLHSKLTSSSAVDEIRTYHEILTMQVEIEENDSNSSSDEDDDILDDLIDDIESEDDENARLMSRTAKMSDEQIARALAKQEELGLGGDEVVLFDGQEDDDEDEDEDDLDDGFQKGSNFVPFSLTQHTSNRTRSKKNRRQRDSFPSAEAFADVLDQDPYGGFDVMDFERPSVRPKRKGKKNDFAFEFDLSDNDLAQQIKSTWLKDREKKTARKRDKLEALEAQLLESAERNHPAAIKAELRRFLIDETETLKLASMDSHIRAGIHRLAKSLKLNSRSEGKEGKGIGRYPVLTKTPYTPQYTIDNVWEINALLESKKFFPKHGPRSFKTPNSAKTTGRARGGGGTADASFRNGEVVGAWAPELSADNKGRAMLEKMGWTSGTGIGAVGNKGSLEAVKQVVKVNKAGLG